MTIYDLVTVASMIEKETASAKESAPPLPLSITAWSTQQTIRT